MNTNITVSLIAIAFSIFLIPNAHAQCDTKTDEFTGKEGTVCESIEMIVEEHPTERIYTSTAMLVKINSMTVMVITTGSDSWNFLGTDNAYALIDGERHFLKVQKVSRNAKSGVVIEQNAVMLDDRDLQALKSASKIRLKIGSAVFEVPSKISYHARII